MIGWLAASAAARIYRTRVTADCQSPSARHLIRLTMHCGEDAQGIPSSLGAGMLMGDEIVRGSPPQISPDKPAQQPNGGQFNDANVPKGPLSGEPRVS